jgi:AChain A
MKFNNLNVRISPSVQIGKNVKIGDNTVIYDNVILEDNVIVSNDCVIGEPLNSYYRDNDGYENPKTFIGENTLIRSHCIIYAGCQIGENFQSGHRVTIREYSEFGANCSVGTLSDIQGYVKFGDYCRLHSNVHIGQGSKLGNFVFIYPYVVFTNDPTPPSNLCIGPQVGDFSQIATGTVLLPGIKIGKHCLIGAASVVGKDVNDFMLALGCPAKEIKNVCQIRDRDTGVSHYPWPLHFDRGMPWEGIGFEEWMKING